MANEHEEQDSSKWLWQPPPSHHQAPRQEPFYSPGFEPSAPPLDSLDFDHALTSGGEDPAPRPYSPFSSQHETPTRPIDLLADALCRVWRTSHTILRFDIRRAIRVQGPVIQSRELQRRQQTQHTGQRQRAEGYRNERDSDAPSQGWLQGIHGGGVQLKLMRIWDFPDKETGQPRLPWNINFGFGAKVEMDEGGHLEPLMRVQSKHLALHLLPSPVFELHGKWPLGGTRLAIKVCYRVPLLNLSTFWYSPTAQLSVNIFNPLGTGFHLSPGGLEFDEHIINIGQNAKLRVAATIAFPREFPVKEGEQPVKVHIDRLGLKARIS